MFDQTKASLLWPMLFHWQLFNPFWLNAQPYGTWILIALAIVVAWWHRDTVFTRRGAVVDVVHDREGMVQ